MLGSSYPIDFGSILGAHSFGDSQFTWALCVGELGVQAPVGFWDPLGLSADGDARSSVLSHKPLEPGEGDL